MEGGASGLCSIKKITSVSFENLQRRRRRLVVGGLVVTSDILNNYEAIKRRGDECFYFCDEFAAVVIVRPTGTAADRSTEGAARNNVLKL